MLTTKRITSRMREARVVHTTFWCADGAVAEQNYRSKTMRRA